ncbi:DENN domain-containing protein 10-like [Dreissena polymorpha]|uniref:UDENN domain-containing protein n=1 Tax=Dreissena polymorpha TaxID=45954 RepID=A0A9D4EWN5_DREPO|nr:DENN domain-containing protein 10-like [Dreissena polymorpha]KAH3787602.1 hypothetical protein DPMN_165728 [Dreissena polymorpha]
MAGLGDLVCCGIIEKDTNGDVLWTWSYPSVTEAHRELFMKKCCLAWKAEDFILFLYSQVERNWYYIFTHKLPENNNLPKVEAFSLVIESKDFNPEKYEALCRTAAAQYCRAGSPTTVLEVYLGVVTKGKWSGDANGKFSVQDFQQKHAFANTNVLGIISIFGLETILIYTAMLLKKKIAVYYPEQSLGELLTFTRSLPAFVWHRQNWQVVYPFVELNKDEIGDLQNTSHYVAGFTDASIESRTELYDVYVNGTTGQISIANHAKEAMAMGKLHKDIALAMVKLTENPANTSQIAIKEISTKTKELLTNLKSLASDDGTIALETLKERKMPPATENFLYSLAACEGLVAM